MPRYQADGETTIIIPPCQTATASGNRDSPTERDRHIEMIRKHGRMAWQKVTTCGQHSLVETVNGRYRAIIDDRLRAHDEDGQIAKGAIGIKVLNRMIRAA
ncbi:MAG: hypothetical protein ACR2RE_12755 [Geminicoccaceae bacterium]